MLNDLAWQIPAFLGGTALTFRWLVLAPFDVHKRTIRQADRQLAALGDERIAIVKERDVLQARVASLRDELTDKRNLREIANALRAQHEQAINRFMHVEFMNLADNDAERQARFLAWENEVSDWCNQLFSLMERIGCTEHDIHSVKTFGSWPFVQFHKFHHWSNAKSLLKFRLDRLGDVSTRYYEKSELIVGQKA